MLKYLSMFLCMNFLSADGLSDLKAALGRLDPGAAIKGTLEAQTQARHGKDGTDVSGRAAAWVEYGPKGLSMRWERPFLDQLDREIRSRPKSEASNSQALGALWAMELRRTYSMLDPASELSRMLESATFLREEPGVTNGVSVRVLHFSVPQSGAPERYRRWIKDYKSTAQIWIDGDGAPISSAQKIQIKGRAFLVISFDQTTAIKATYAVLGGRLVCLRHEEAQEGGGGGEFASSRTVRTFRPAS